MITIDKLAYSSKLRNKSPALKSVLSVGTLLICVAARSAVFAAIVLFVMGVLAVYYGKTSLSRYLGLLYIPLAFFIMSTIAIIVNLTPTPADLLSLPVGQQYLSVSSASLLQGVTLILTALGSVSCLYFLVLTTPVTDLLAVMARIHIPKLMIELMLLIYRFIFVLLDLSSAMTVAQKCRLGNRDFRTSLRSAGQLLAVLLVRALGKSSRLYDAMESRLYDGEIRVLNETAQATKAELLGTALFLAGLSALAVLLHMGGV